MKLYLPRREFEQALTSPSGRVASIPVRLLWHNDRQAIHLHRDPGGSSRFHVTSVPQWEPFSGSDEVPYLVAIQVGSEGLAGEVRCAISTSERSDRIREIHLVGPGMHILRSQRRKKAASTAYSPLDLWSRTIGALGRAPWSRLRNLKYAVVGAGRTGSLLAQGITEGWGAKQLLMIDPDRIEPHNVGEMAGISVWDVGRFKTEVLAERLTGNHRSKLSFQTCESLISERKSWQLIEQSDVLFSCVDHDAGRWSASVLATVYGRPIIDIASGVQADGGRRMGIDIRLTIPGEQCLMCLSGMSELDAIRGVLATADDEQAFLRTRQWQSERAGSLRSLNEIAVGIAQRIWEDYVSERIHTGTWIHLEFSEEGRVDIVYPRSPARNGSCRYCEQFGNGELGIRKSWEILQSS